MFSEFKSQLREKGSLRFYVRAVPNARDTKVLEMMEDESVRVAIAAPAEMGRANKELVRFWLMSLGFRKRKLRLFLGLLPGGSLFW